jgi:hypothetical protein
MAEKLLLLTNHTNLSIFLLKQCLHCITRLFIISRTSVLLVHLTSPMNFTTNASGRCSIVVQKYNTINMKAKFPGFMDRMKDFLLSNFVCPKFEALKKKSDFLELWVKFRWTRRLFRVIWLTAILLTANSHRLSITFPNFLTDLLSEDLRGLIQS